VRSGPVAEECVTEPALKCGETRVESTVEGTVAFDGEGYVSWYCATSASLRGDYSARERAFAFTHPGTGDATITLHSPCADLDLITVRAEMWSSDRECPTADHTLTECEFSDETSDDDSVNIWQNSESTYLIIVDGSNPAEAPFELTVECE